MSGLRFQVSALNGLAGALLTGALCTAQVCTAAEIAESEITKLEQDLAQAARGGSSVEVRRGCKNVIRKARALLATAPEADGRYRVLGIIFDGQKRLLSLEATEPNRAALFATCETLVAAPNGYTEQRLEADMLLSERDLAGRNATVDERIQALQQMLARYRGTPGEWKSLMIGSLIANKLLEFDVANDIGDTMQERFAGDHTAIMFRRKENPGGVVEAVFSGTYESAEGESIAFPSDRLGYNVLLYFWSRATPKIDEHLGAVTAMQEEFPGVLEIYSFNVDQLPDAGQKQLRDLGLDWTALHLPGGRENSAYRAYAQNDPCGIFVNAQGQVHLVAIPRHGGGEAAAGVYTGEPGGWNVPGMAQRFDDARYLAQLRYLFTGDFLVAGSWTASPVPEPERQAIQACFVQPPFRYRLTPDQSLANYRTAETLCRAAIEGHATADDLWQVRNRRIVALLGMWNLERDPGHLDAAVNEAEAVKKMAVPPRAKVVSHFCLARNALRRRESDPENLLADFIRETGGEKAPASALAAATVLALQAQARTAHEMYRERLLAGEDTVEPALWPVVSFLRDKHHRYRNFHASPGGNGYSRPQKYAFRHMLSGMAEPREQGRRLELQLTALDGTGEIKIPECADGQMLGVILAEPPAGDTEQTAMVQRIEYYADAHANRGVEVVAVFLSEDTATVKSMAAGAKKPFRAGMLPGGLRNPAVRKLGILSADRIPNLVLLRPDGTVAWTLSGLQYRTFRSDPGYATTRAIENNIEKVRCDAGFESLEKGEFRKALQQFESYKPAPSRRGELDFWGADRLHGRALAHLGLNEWDAALEQIDAAIARRKHDFKSAMCKCHGIVEMLHTKAAILEKLKRDREAKSARRLAARERLPHAKLPPGVARSGVPVGVYYDWLKQIRMAMLEAE